MTDRAAQPRKRSVEDSAAKRAEPCDSHFCPCYREGSEMLASSHCDLLVWIARRSRGLLRQDERKSIGDLMAQAETDVEATQVPSLDRAWELLERAYAEGGAAVLGWTGDEVMVKPPAGPSWTDFVFTVTKDPNASHEDLVLVLAIRVPHPDEMSFDEVVHGKSADHACCKRHVPGPVFTQFDGDPTPEFICPECGGRWVWDDDEAEGGAWYWDPENDRTDIAGGSTGHD